MLRIAYESRCFYGKAHKGSTSVLHKQFVTTAGQLPHIIAWEKDIGSKIDKEDWSSRIHKGTMNVALIEAGYKVLSQWYLVPDHLSKMYPGSASFSFRGCR